MTAAPRRTPLHPQHLAAGARMTAFAGWEMPLQYQGIAAEVRAVRSACGIFDISHMGELRVRGPRAAQWLDEMLAARLSALEPGAAAYTLLLNERGGVQDDLIAYRLAPEDFLLVVNAAVAEADWDWLRQRVVPGVELENCSEAMGALAVQGPGAPAVFASVFASALPSARNRVAPLPGPWQGSAWVCTTGYTGEAGFEVVGPVEALMGWWQQFRDAGCQPCGLGARDVLRLEMGYPLNGADLSPDRTPLEAGLGFAVDLSKERFVGREALLAQKAAGLKWKLCGLRLDQPLPPLRAHYRVIKNGEVVGELTSGGLSPTLNAPIGMGYLPAEFAKPGEAVEVDIRGKAHPGRVVKRPFIQPPSAARSL